MKFFVYGTLMKKLPDFNPILPEYGATYLADVQVRGDMFSVHDSYPALKEGDGVVHGELWDMPDDHHNLSVMIGRLDAYEGFSRTAPEEGLYNKELMPTYNGDIPVCPAVAYVYNKSVSDEYKVEHGDWCKYKRG